MSPSIFPPDDAGPRQIRQYLVDHLMSKHDTTLEFAQTTADLWQLGRGTDFRLATMSSQDVAMKEYISIFGNKVAPYLLSSVRQECWNHWRASTLGRISLWTIIACITISTALCFHTFSSKKYAGKPFAYVFRNSCPPIGPPMLICGYLEYKYSQLFPVLLFVLGFYGTSIAIISTMLVQDYKNEQRVKYGQSEEKEKPT